MTDKEFRRTKKRIRRIAKRWLTCLGLMWWSVDLIYSRDGRSVMDSQQESGQTWDCAACTSAKWEYLKASVTFNVPMLADYSDEDLERIVIHELCHILVREMREWAPEDVSQERIAVGRRAEERVVSTLANAFRWTAARFVAAEPAAKAAANSEGKSKERKASRA